MDTISKDEVKVLGLSGPDGAGKGYLTQNAIEILNNELGFRISEIQMISTRSPREGEQYYTNMEELSKSSSVLGGKRCVSDELFDKLLANSSLVGDHKNDNGFRYAYLVNDFKVAKGALLIELNPVFQSRISEDLSKHGINFVSWIGLMGNIDYLRTNIKSRQPDMTDEELDKKIGMAESIIETLNELRGDSKLQLFTVGWENRESMAKEFADLIKGLIEQ